MSWNRARVRRSHAAVPRAGHRTTARQEVKRRALDPPAFLAVLLEWQLQSYRAAVDDVMHRIDDLDDHVRRNREERTLREADHRAKNQLTAEDIAAVLGKYGFRDVPQAYHNLMALASETIPFLSTRRCRHFLASIAPRLLNATTTQVQFQDNLALSISH